MRPACVLGVAFACLALTVPAPMPAYAQPEPGEHDGNAIVVDSSRVRYDTASIGVRRPAASTMERFAKDEAFAYDRDQHEAESLWDRLMHWIVTKVLRTLGVRGSADALNVIGRVIMGVALVYVILKLTKTDLRSVFTRRSGATVSAFVDADENIHEMDFGALIDEAVGQGNHRRAVRLLYLQQIKALTDRSLIDWRIDKTNDDYQRELAGSPLASGFAEIRRVFEYVWYGDAPVDALRYPALREYFTRFATMLPRAR